MDEIQFNLDMLNVQTGMRSVTAKAKSPGYDDSYESNTVMFADTMELSGTWRFKDTLNPPTNDTWRLIEHIPFTSYLNSSGVHTKFKIMQFSKNVYIQATERAAWCLWYSSTGEETGTAVSSQMYVETKGWDSDSSPECKTVTFDGVVVVSKEFYEWFTANAVKQEQEQLTAPIISLDGDILTITTMDSRTETFAIFVDGVEMATVTVGNEIFFTPTEGLTYTISTNGTYYTCTGIGTATATDIVIAGDIDGLPVSYIGEAAFHQSAITSVVIGEGVKWIELTAFGECTALQSIEIPISVTRIDEAMCYGCTALTQVKYAGTMAQWNEISKGTHLFDSVPATHVECADGNVSIEGV